MMIVNYVAGRYSAIVNFLSLYGDSGSLLCYEQDNPGRGNRIDFSDLPTSVCGFSRMPNPRQVARVGAVGWSVQAIRHTGYS